MTDELFCAKIPPMNTEGKKKKFPRIVVICIAVFLTYLAIHYWDPLIAFIGKLLSAAAPLFIGAIIAFIVNIFLRFYEKHFFRKSEKDIVKKLRRPVCILLSYLTVAAIITAIAFLVIPQLIDAGTSLFERLPVFLENIRENQFVMKIVSGLPEGMQKAIQTADPNLMLNEILSFLTTGILGKTGVTAVITGVASSVFKTFIGLIFSVYLLASKEKIKAGLKRFFATYLHPTANKVLLRIASVLNESFRNYLVGQFTEALIMGTLCLIGLSIFRFPYAPIIAALMAVGVLIPIFGAYIGAIAGFILVSSVSPVQGFFFLIFIIVVTQVEGNLIYPRVAGFNLGLPGIWILAAVIVWGALFGFPGMIFGVPLTAAFYKLLKENMKGRAEKKAAEKDNETKPPASEGDLSGTEQSIETLNNENKGNL